jgi:hypothetical protein
VSRHVVVRKRGGIVFSIQRKMSLNFYFTCLNSSLGDIAGNQRDRKAAVPYDRFFSDTPEKIDFFGPRTGVRERLLPRFM